MAEIEAGEVGVVHLVRCANGVAPLRRFLDSYDACPSGLAHDLIFVLKGFSGNAPARAAAVEAIAGRRHSLVEVPDDGLDLDAYRAVTRRSRQDYLLFFNSFSVIAADGWLAKMHACASRGECGIVGASGSWESLLSDEIELLRRSMRSRISGAASENAASRTGGAAPLEEPRERGWRRLWSVLRDYSAFPNPHIRTNAFMLSRAFMDRLDWPATLTKDEAYRTESGRRGFTAQALKLGLKPAIVGRDGRAYFGDEWPASGTFWQRGQENLMVEDNQTREYQAASAGERLALTYRAWRGHGGT